MSVSAAFFVAISLIILIPAQAQERVTPPASPVAMNESLLARFSDVLHPSIHGCSDSDVNATAELGLRARACFYADRLISPGGVAHAFFSTAFSEWRNRPWLRHADSDDVFKRFSAFYERKSARSAGEFLAGYLRHEDFRPRVSASQGFQARSRAALLSVLTTPGNGDELRPAFAPIAGAFSSGLVGAAVFPYHRFGTESLRLSAGTYGCYFVSAWFREFKPELTTFSSRLLKLEK